jgi:hypothetical protein
MMTDDDDPYEFSIFSEQEQEELRRKGKIGVGEAWGRAKKLELIPVVSMLYPESLIDSIGVKMASDRLQKNEYTNELDKIKDQNKMKDFLRSIEEERIRGHKWGANVMRTAWHMPAFATEFFTTGLLFKGAVSGTKVAATKGIKAGARAAAVSMAKEVAKKGVKKKVKGGIAGRLIKGQGESIARAAATTPMMYNMMGTKYNENRIFANVSLTEKGVSILEAPAETKWKSFYNAYGDTFFEIWSEQLGDKVFGPIAGAASRGISSKLSKETVKKVTAFMDKIPLQKKLAKAFGRQKILEKTGIQTMPEEILEEFVGNQARAIFNIDSFGAEDSDNPIDRMRSALGSDFDNLSVMAGAFSIPGVSSYAGSKLYNKLRYRGMSEAEIEQVRRNTSETEVSELLSDLLNDEDPIFQEAMGRAIAGQDLTEEQKIVLDQKYNTYLEKDWVARGETDEQVSQKTSEEKAQEIQESTEKITEYLAFHGTVTNFSEFSKEKASPESDLGAGIYFSSDQYDVETNYATSEGADLTNKIARRAEQIEQEKDISYEEAKEEATQEIAPERPGMIKAKLKIKNPVEVGGEKETFFDFTEEFDEETEEYGEAEGKLVDFIEKFRLASERYHDVESIENTISEIYQAAMDWGGISASDLIGIIKKSEGAMYATDENGNIVVNEIIREAFEMMGHDSIIDYTVAEKFENMDIPKDTIHYVMFNAKDIDIIEKKDRIKKGKKESKEKKEPKQTRAEKFQAMVDRIKNIAKEKLTLKEKKEVIKEVLDYFASERKQYTRRIKRYKKVDGKEPLKEEYDELPRAYRSSKGVTLDEIASEIDGVEGDMEARDFLINLEAEYQKAKINLAEINEQISDVEESQKVKSEVSTLKQRLSDFKSGIAEATKNLKKLFKDETRQAAEIRKMEKKELAALNAEVSATARKLLPSSGKKYIKAIISAIDSVKKKEDAPAAIARIIDNYEQFVDRQARAKAINRIMRKYKRPENIVDVRYQNEVERELDRLGEGKKEQRKKLKEMSTEELNDLAMEIGTLVEQGKRTKAEKDKYRKMAAEIMRAAGIKAAGGHLTAEQWAELPEEVRAKRRKMLKQEITRAKIKIEYIRPLRLIRIIFGEWGERVLYDSIEKAETHSNMMKMERMAKVREIFDKHEIVKFDLAEEIEVMPGWTYTINEIMYLYAQRGNKEAKNAIIQGERNRLGDARPMTEEIYDRLVAQLQTKHPNISAAADEIREVVAERWDAIQSVLQNTYNVKPKTMKWYFPIKRIFDVTDPMAEDSFMGIDIMGDVTSRSGHGINYSSIPKGMGFERKVIEDQHQLPMRLDFLEVALSSIGSQEHLIQFAHLQKMYNSIVADKTMKSAVIENHGEQAWEIFDRWAKEAIDPRKQYKPMTGTERKLKHIRKAIGVAFLGFNPVTAMKQFPSAHLALKYTNPAQLYNSMWRVSLANKKDGEEIRKRIMAMDPSIAGRVVDQDIKDIMSGVGDVSRNVIMREIQRHSEWMGEESMKWILNMDRWAVLAVYDAVYQSNKDKLGHEKAMDLAHKALLETQPQGRRIDLPDAYRQAGEWMRMALMFTNQLNQIYNMMVVDSKREWSEGDKGRAIAGLSSIMFSSLLIQMASTGFWFPDDEEEAREWWIAALFGSFVSAIPIIGPMAMSFFKGYEPATTPIPSIIKKIKYAGSLMENEQYDEAIMQGISATSIFAGIPLPSQPSIRFYRGIKDLYNRDTNDIRRLIWSDSALYQD